METIEAVDRGDVAAAVSTGRRLGYRPQLDGFRAVAICLVVMFHGAIFAQWRWLEFPRQGVLGVDLFFVLSGFLITTLLLEERDRAGRVSFRAFYIRRARRLLPALSVLLVTALIAAAVTTYRHPGSQSFHRELITTAYALGFATNFGVVWDGGSIAYGMGHLWSLATEDQFYLVWPFVLASVARFRARYACAILAVALVAELVRELQLYHDHATWNRVGLAPDTRSTGIMVGCMLAVVLRTEASRRLLRLSRLISPLALVGFVLLLSLKLSDAALFVGGTTLFALVSAVLIAASLEAKSWLARALSLAPVVYVGRISYSLYLWHFPILYSARFFDGPRTLVLEGLALATALAALSYHFVELPFLRGRKPPVRRRPVDGSERLNEQAGV